MALLLFLSSQYVLTVVMNRGEAIDEIGLVIDTNYVGPIEQTPTGIREELLNYPLFVFIFTLIADSVFVVWLWKSKDSGS
jgi:hypothetical protein